MIQSTKNIPTPVRETIKFLESELTFELNHYAYRADAAITIQKGETVILATVSTGEQDIESNFLPLSVEYIEKLYAGGIISSSRFLKREARPSDDAVLKARQIDHAIRSLFPKNWRKPVAVIITVLAYDGENDPEQLSVIGASTALMLSSVPFHGPSASIKVGLDQTDQLVWGPKVSQEEHLKMDMVISVVGERILNVEGWADETDESIMSKVMEESVTNIQPMLEFQTKLAEKYGRQKLEYSEKSAPMELVDRVERDYSEQITRALLNREERIGLINSAKADLASKLNEELAATGGKANTNDIETAVEYVARKLMRAMVLDKEQRTSGRALNEVRELKIEVGVLPRVHGSAVFTRGITQSLSVLTLGSMRMAQKLESFEGEDQKRFMHHYASPGFSYGSAERYQYFPGRREIGHGNIGENALRRIIPSEAEFPYTIRVSSEIMSSNGSTSMAATCAACLALLDGGVKLKGLVAGIALGLVTNDADVTQYKILTDMEDVEDFYGDMDFKVTGTKNGITAIQLDNKLKGIPVKILQEALGRSKEARLEILVEMAKVISEPRASLSTYAPKIEIVKINPERIGELIGPGGKNIKRILEACENKVEIDIQDNGDIYVLAVNEEYRKRALDLIGEVTAEAEIGMTYTGTVGKIADYGMFVDVSANISGLVHVSELAEGFIKDVRDLFNEGDRVRVKVVARDDLGRLKLSVKQADPA